MKLQLPLATLREQLGDVVVSSDADATFIVENISSLDKAQPQDIACIVDRGDASVFDPVSRKAVEESKAGVFIAQQAVVPGKKYIIVKDVPGALERLARLMEQQYDVQGAQQPQIDLTAIIHSSAVIEKGAVIGAACQIGAQVFVGKHCRIGRNVILYPGVKILDRCVVGDSTIIHAGAVVGSDGFGYQVTSKGLRKISQIGIVRIGNNVEIGANCTLDRASFGETVIGDGVKMDNGVHIAHNVVIGPCCAIIAQTGIAGSTVIGAGCQIGGQVAIRDHLTIGNGVKIVSKSAVLNDLKDGETVCGIPAIPFGQWKRITVAVQKAPELLKMMTSKAQTKGTSRVGSWFKRIFG